MNQSVVGIILMIALTVILLIAFVVFTGDTQTYQSTPSKIIITIFDRIDVQPWGAVPFCTVLTFENKTYYAKDTGDCVKLQKGFKISADVEGDLISNIVVIP